MKLHLPSARTALRGGAAEARAVVVPAAILVAAAAVGLPSATLADTLRPMQAGSFAMKDWRASVYYTETSGGYEVVTTVAPASEGSGAPIRYIVQLSPGQGTSVEIGSFDANAEPVVLAIQREADWLSAAVKSRTKDMPVAMD